MFVPVRRAACAQFRLPGGRGHSFTEREEFKLDLKTCEISEIGEKPVDLS